MLAKLLIIWIVDIYMCEGVMYCGQGVCVCVHPCMYVCVHAGVCVCVCMPVCVCVWGGGGYVCTQVSVHVCVILWPATWMVLQTVVGFFAQVNCHDLCGDSAGSVEARLKNTFLAGTHSISNHWSCWFITLIENFLAGPHSIFNNLSCYYTIKVKNLSGRYA